jgi:hypothetical protein
VTVDDRADCGDRLSDDGIHRTWLRSDPLGLGEAIVEVCDPNMGFCEHPVIVRILRFGWWIRFLLH